MSVLLPKADPHRRHMSVNSNREPLLFLFGALLLLFGLAGTSTADTITIQYDENQIKWVICKLYTLQEGAFGALVMTVAGICAIVASSMGAYRSSLSLVVVGCGCFILHAMVTLFFQDFSCTNADEDYLVVAPIGSSSSRRPSGGGGGRNTYNTSSGGGSSSNNAGRWYPNPESPRLPRGGMEYPTSEEAELSLPYRHERG